MKLFVQISYGALLAAIAVQVNGHVCYSGQEPSPAGLVWSVHATPDSTGCTAYQLGGFNSQPLGVNRTTVGGDLEVLHLKPPENGKSACDEKSPCAKFKGTEEGWLGPYPEGDHASLPFDQFSFAVNAKSDVRFVFNDEVGNWVYIVGITAVRGIYVDFGSYIAKGSDADFPGRFWVTYGNGTFDVSRMGRSYTSLLKHTVELRSRRDIWSTELVVYFNDPVVWEIYAPCI